MMAKVKRKVSEKHKKDKKAAKKDVTWKSSEQDAFPLVWTS